MSNILDKSVLDSKDYNDPNSVLYRGDLLESPDPQNKSTSQNNNNNKLIFVHGYLGFGSPEGGRNYWNSEFIQGGKEFVEANLDFFVDTEHSATSNTYERTRQGFSYAKKYYSQLINGMDKNKNKFSLISHSMGGAFSFGMAMYLMGQNWKIDSMFFFLNTYTPDTKNQLDVKNKYSKEQFVYEYRNSNDPVIGYYLTEGLDIKGSDLYLKEEAPTELKFVHRYPIDQGRYIWNKLYNFMIANNTNRHNLARRN